MDLIPINGPKDIKVNIGKHLLFKSKKGTELHCIIKRNNPDYTTDVVTVGLNGKVTVRTCNLAVDTALWFLVRHTDLDCSEEMRKGLVQLCEDIMGQKGFSSDLMFVEWVIERTLAVKVIRRALFDGAKTAASDVTKTGAVIVYMIPPFVAY